ncbi:MAG: hypothetical protein QXU09_04850 [Thermoproteota archaeon]
MSRSGMMSSSSADFTRGSWGIAGREIEDRDIPDSRGRDIMVVPRAGGGGMTRRIFINTA